MTPARQWSALARAALMACACAGAGCALPAVSAGTFLPAGDLQRGQLQATASLEVGRVIAAPSDVGDPAVSTEQEKWEVATWVASDVSLRWAATRRLALEAQVKLANPVLPFVPSPVGGALGARLRLLDRPLGADSGLAVELGGRLVFVGTTLHLTRYQGNRHQEDSWTYRAVGLEVPLVVTQRLSPLVALTGAPFARIYYIRVRHAAEGNGTTTISELDWTPVLTGGLGVSLALQLGPVEAAPGIAAELATRAGPGAKTQLVFQPGLSLGTRW